MFARSSITTSTDNSNFDHFIALLDRYVAFLELAGKNVFRSPPEEAQALFARLDHQRAMWMLERLQNELAALEELTAAKESLNNNSRLLWRFLQRGKFKPCSDIFDKIAQDDVLEVFASNHIHIWQSLNYFDVVSITIEQVYTETWYNLMVRDPGVEQTLGCLAVKVFNGEVTTTVPTGVDWHWIKEVGTAQLLQMELLIRYISPLTLNGKTVALLVVSRVRNLHSTLNRAGASDRQDADLSRLT